MRTLGQLLGLTVFAGAFLACADTTEPGLGPVQIAFSRADNDGAPSALYVVGEDGRNPTQLVPDAFAGALEWSPDGSKLLFVTNTNFNQTFVINADGTGRVTFATISYGAHWSPDGTRIAFTAPSFLNSPHRIGLMNPDGTNESFIGDGTTNDLLGSWSPDGSKIVFSRVSGTTQEIWEIWVTAPDGSSQVRLASSAASESEPLWSPDGTKIAFLQWYPDGRTAIFTINPDGSGETSITNETEYSVTPSSLKWSPDGQRIAFTTNSTAHAQIWIVNADGTGAQTLTAPAYDSDAPDWSPDGTQLVFSSNRDGHRQLYKMNADGTNQTRFVTSTTSDRLPLWRPR